MSDVVTNAQTGELVGLPSFSDADADMAVVIVDPYTKLADKDVLVGRAFDIVNAKIITDRETGNTYWMFEIVDVEDNLWRMTDGGTGIASQFPELLAKYGAGRMRFANGLRVSEYAVDKDGLPVTPERGNKAHGKAKTYYFA